MRTVLVSTQYEKHRLDELINEEIKKIESKSDDYVPGNFGTIIDIKLCVDGDSDPTILYALILWEMR